VTELSDDDLRMRAHLKRELRKRRRQVRGALPKEARLARSAKIVAGLEALPEWAAARRILAFVALTREPQLGDAVERLWARGVEVFAPGMGEDFANLELRPWHADSPLEESGYGFLQPPRAPVEGGVDLVVVPALAVDGDGHRLGYGRGYYDRLLPTLERAFRVATVFAFERMTELPTTPWDVRVDAVVTDEGVERF
jgi:5-formyltetrahydrofolate cyclo-ligase